MQERKKLTLSSSSSSSSQIPVLASPQQQEENLLQPTTASNNSNNDDDDSMYNAEKEKPPSLRGAMISSRSSITNAVTAAATSASSSSSRKKFLKIFIFILGSLSVVGFFFVGIGKNNTDASSSSSSLLRGSKDNYDYVVIIDAGSSGSRAHVFRHNDKVGVVPEHESLKVKPGLSSFAANPENAGASLKDAIEFAKKHVPSSKIKDTPLMLKATAGMRLLPLEEMKGVMSNVRQYLDTTGFQFDATRAEIISGEEEGKLGWMSVNYLNNSPGSWGVMELGGASIQVTMKINNNNENDVPKEHIRPYRLPNESSPGEVYTHSFLGLGMESARRAYSELLVTTNASEDPCLQKGYVKPTEGGEFELFSGNASMKPSGNYEQCAALINRAIFENEIDKQMKEDCKYKNCLFNGLYAPKMENKQFWAFENFYYTPSALGVDGVPGETTISLLKDAAKINCDMDWNTMDETYPKDWQPKEINNKWCFGSTYIYLLLTNGLNLQPTSKITISNDVNKNGIDWALGAALQALSSSK